MTKGNIVITNKVPHITQIDIEGVIGVPEQWQFDRPGERVATYEKFREAVASIARVESAEVVVNIRSTGGNVNDALMIFDALTSLEATVTTRCYGYVASAATIIAQAADEGRREVSANSLYLIHGSVCSAEGNTGELMRSVEMLEQTDRRIAAIYAARAGRPAEEFVRLMKENGGKGRWLSPEETVALSLADRITGASQITAAEELTVLNSGLPPIPKHKRNHFMDISKKWNAILETLGLLEKETVQTPSDTEEESEIPLCISLRHEQEVAELNNRIAELEASNARLSAAATRTMPKEDPSVHQTRLSGNSSAYTEDVMGIRQKR